MTVKIYVLDTNVLMHNPNSILSFEDNQVVLPITVIEELDRFKKGSEELNRNTREAVRILDGLRAFGTLCKGVKTNNGGLVRVDLNNKKALGKFPPGIDFSVPDNRILSVAYNLTKQEELKKKIGGG